MNPVTGWTGRTACALQAALRLSNEAFAERLGIGVRTVASWHQKPTLRPDPKCSKFLTQRSNRHRNRLRRDSPCSWAIRPAPRARRLRTPDRGRASRGMWSGGSAPTRAPARRSTNSISTLDREPGTDRQRVASRLTRLDVRHLQDRASRRRRIGQRRIAEALGAYYRDRTSGHGRYRVRNGQDIEIVTSVLTHPDWLDLDCPLTAVHDRLTLNLATESDLSLDEEAAGAAAQRLAETLATRTRLVDMPPDRYWFFAGEDHRSGRGRPVPSHTTGHAGPSVKLCTGTAASQTGASQSETSDLKVAEGHPNRPTNLP